MDDFEELINEFSDEGEGVADSVADIADDDLLEELSQMIDSWGVPQQLLPF